MAKNTPVDEKSILEMMSSSTSQSTPTNSEESTMESKQEQVNSTEVVLSKQTEKYNSTFLEIRTISERETLQANKKTIDAIKRILVNCFDNKIALSVWIDNILADHINKNQNIFQQIYENKPKPTFSFSSDKNTLLK